VSKLRKYEGGSGGPYVKGDQFDVRSHLNRPLYVEPVELVTGIKTAHDKEGDKVRLKAHIYDIDADTVYCNAIIWNETPVERLTPYLGEATVIQFVNTKAQTGPYTYQSVVEGSAEDFDAAEYKEEIIRKAIDDRIEEQIAEAKAEAEAKTQAPAGSGKGPFKG
jgi:hypothetical protein